MKFETVIISLLCLFTAVTSASPINFGVASDFNAFFSGDMNAHNSDLEGRLAVGGNLSLRDYSIGMELSNSHGKRDDVIVGGHISYTNGRIYNGNARSSDSTNPFNETVGFYSDDPNTLNGSFISGNPIDFSAAERHLKEQSNTISGLANRGTKAMNPTGELHLTGSQGTNVFNLSNTEIADVSAFYVDAPVDSNVIINISGGDVEMSNFGFFRNGNRIPDNDDKVRHDGSFTDGVLFNIFEATTVDIFSIAIKGSILAPSAEISFYDGHIDGQLIGASFNGDVPGECCSGQINNYAFSPVPIPPAIVIFMSGLLGFLGMNRLRL